MNDPAPSSPPLLQMRDVSRRFPGVLALSHVDFDLLAGEVHALVGENGAGKSTLINILAGILQPSSGVLEIQGQPTVLPDPVSAQRAGINVIFQEFNLLPHLTVAENIFINREPTRGLRIDWPAMYRRSSRGDLAARDRPGPRMPSCAICQWPSSRWSRSPGPGFRCPRGGDG